MTDPHPETRAGAGAADEPDDDERARRDAADDADATGAVADAPAAQPRRGGPGTTV